jgi:hypothetical protein
MIAFGLAVIVMVALLTLASLAFTGDLVEI